ncbi:thioredoxin-related transmembrane protein 1-like [Paramacrobiotus metropolitanus]|uniref:thioredoxin-related transmembrane protein 1-like n=1 Tax=Paramacrobiotus metropolitanus TaxID=2943436 RepID=UPI002445886B|nr:thioredoxin-related transmembrane protein 1-like [Paramacrobiotus metropolitanus]
MVQRHHSELCRIMLWVSFVFSFYHVISAESPDAKVKRKGEVIELTESNWDQILKGEWMVEFHAPWCPACRDFQPEFKRFAEWDRDLGFKAGAVDVHAHPGLSGRFLISALPTVYHVKEGEFRQYTGVRDRERMMRFMEEKDWQKLTPVSPWLHPSGFHMGLVGNFFKLSMKLKNLQTWMVEDQGLPNWVTYAVFAIGTIVLGGTIGVLLVFLIELFPQRGRTHIKAAAKESTEGRIRTQEKAESSASPTPSGTDAEGTDEEGIENSASAGGSPSSGSEEEELQEETKAEPEEDNMVRRRKARREE